MRDYRRIYPYEVMDYITEGKLVYALDRFECDVFCVNNIDVGSLGSTLKSAKAEKDRFDFWIIEESEVVEA